jgi:hypothetical protein
LSAARGQRRQKRRQRKHVLVQDVELLCRCVLLQQLGCDLALGGEDDAVLGEDTDGGTGMGDGFQGILDLVETTFGGEDGCLWRWIASAC